MIRKIALFSVCTALLTASCSKPDDDNTTETPSEKTLEQQIAEIAAKPYSTLTPEEQKVKLESEANGMLTQMESLKTIEAPETLENFENLLSIGSIDFLSGKEEEGVTDLLQVSDVYGIYEWNKTSNNWDKKSSTTELKFIFPSKSDSNTNDATLSLTSTASNIKATVPDSSDDDEIYLPSSANATLKINGTDIATIAATAKYGTQDKYPTEATFKVTLKEGYVYEMSAAKGAANTAKASLTYNGKNLINLTNNYSGDVDAIIKDETTGINLGAGNSVMNIMDNFAIVATINAEGLKNAQEANDKTYVYPEYSNDESYYTALNNYYKNSTAANVQALNDNIKGYLVSRKDGTKIAEVFQKSVKGDSYPSNGGTIQYYDEVQYLRFNDKTEVAADVYFTTGFDDFKQKFEDFMDGE